MTLPNFEKDPDEVLDYTVNWAASLLSGETISSSTWVVDSGITEDSSSLSSSAATIWLSGGIAGTEYKITNRIVTSDGRTYERSFRIDCVDSKQR